MNGTALYFGIVAIIATVIAICLVVAIVVIYKKGGFLE